jgi:thiamine transport system ATP-binding protein
MIDLEAVTFDYEAMHMRFTLALPEGCFMAVTGPSGAGKSTLLNLIAGFEAPLSGLIRIAGRDVTCSPPAERPLSMIFQDNNVFAHLDVWSNVALGLSPRLKLTGSQKAEVEAALQRVGLEALARRRPTEVSGGERQRIAIARALVRRQPVLLMDEPFTALGPALREEMLGLLLDLKTERSLTFMMVTHQPVELRRAANLFCFVDAGVIRHVLPPAKFFSTSAPPEIRSYLG